jgi:hypothetical protein
MLLSVQHRHRGTHHHLCGFAEPDGVAGNALRGFHEVDPGQIEAWHVAQGSLAVPKNQDFRGRVFDARRNEDGLRW